MICLKSMQVSIVAHIKLIDIIPWKSSKQFVEILVFACYVFIFWFQFQWFKHLLDVLMETSPISYAYLDPFDLLMGMFVISFVYTD